MGESLESCGLGEGEGEGGWVGGWVGRTNDSELVFLGHAGLGALLGLQLEGVKDTVLYRERGWVGGWVSLWVDCFFCGWVGGWVGEFMC